MLQPSSLSTSTAVDYDEKRGRFLIRCPVFDNARVRAMPNRRWDGKAKLWTAPAIRANIEFIADRYCGSQSAVVSPTAQGKIDGYLAERAGRVQTAKFPAHYGFKRQPRAKQLEALNKTYGLHAVALFMDMRTGKTKVAIDWACAARIEGRIDRVILICPLTLRKNWAREFEKDATIPVDYHRLDTKDKGKAFDRWHHAKHDFKWLLVGVESLAAGSAIEYARKFALGGSRVLCIIDESSKIKTHSANRSKNAVSLRNMCEYRMIATGTPMTKNPLDLFMQFEFLDPDIIGIGDFFSFRVRYAIMGGYENREIIGYENLDELVELISPYTYQVRQNEVFESSKEYVIREVELTPEQRALYADMKKFSKLWSDDSDQGIVVQNVLEKMLRMQEISGGFVSYQHTEEQLEELRTRMGPSKKLPRTYRIPIRGRNPKVEELLACAEDYEGPMLVWCAFRDEITAVAAALRKEYGDGQVVELHGGIDEAQRDINVQEMFQKKNARFLVGNAATGGMGLTMDVACTIVYYSNTFNFVDREQSEERGTAENKATLIVDLVASRTVDEIILSANEEKKDVSEYIRGKIDDERRKTACNAAVAALRLLDD